jgi:hypothetical protein
VTLTVETLNNYALTDAEMCRANGWEPGVILEGSEGYGRTRIMITAVGEDAILAKAISHDGDPVDRHEGVWTLRHREWRKVGRLDYQPRQVSQRQGDPHE